MVVLTRGKESFHNLYIYQIITLDTKYLSTLFVNYTSIKLKKSSVWAILPKMTINTEPKEMSSRQSDKSLEVPGEGGPGDRNT